MPFAIIAFWSHGRLLLGSIDRGMMIGIGVNY